MQRMLGVWLAALVVVGWRVAFAGVIIQQETVTQTANAPITDARTIMVQGNRQRLETGGQAVIIDLNQGTMTLINPDSQTYSQIPFPPRGGVAAMMHSLNAFDLNMHKTGGEGSVGGYKCSIYSGTSNTTVALITIRGCFSQDAPGAKEYGAFTRVLAEKFTGTPLGAVENHPQGIPMKLETSTKFTNFTIPGMPPDQAEAMKQMLANRPPTSSVTTTLSVKSAEVPASTFTVPQGYSQTQIGGESGGGAGGPAPASTPYEGE